MKKKYHITEEEFQAIKDAISKTLNLWAYEYISAEDKNFGSEISMNKNTFFESLKREFVICDK